MERLAGPSTVFFTACHKFIQVSFPLRMYPEKQTWSLPASQVLPEQHQGQDWRMTRILWDSESPGEAQPQSEAEELC